MPEYLTTGYVYCTCHTSIDLQTAERRGAFGVCPKCSRLFNWPTRKAESKAAVRRRRAAERDREPTLF